ncbi:MAG: T7SS effector LXG polymorphic toxin [Bacteroides sp.]|nr:T7SS effector LXG polymorphic toxin [Bacteroides sp.]MCM1549742.1 T7SS effector LXG polymorphic toxin [Clostridium sp.]
MGYNLNYSSIRTLQTTVMASITHWEEEYNSVYQDLMSFAEEPAFTGAGAEAMKQYITGIHLPLCQSLLTFLAEYKARFALFVSGLYEYDGSKYANLNEDALREVEEQLQRTGYELIDFRTQMLEEMNGICDLGVESTLKSSDTYLQSLQEEIQRSQSLRDGVGEYEHAAFRETEGLQEHIEELLRSVQFLREQGEVEISSYEPGSLSGMTDLSRLQTYTGNSFAYLSENQEAIEAAYAHYTEVWEEIADEIREQRIKQGLNLINWSTVGIAATVLTFGTLGPEAISMETAILGSFALAFDMSNMEEGALELYYGCVGDIHTTAVNPIRDTVFFGWQEGYDVSCMGVNMGFSYYSTIDTMVAASALKKEQTAQQIAEIKFDLIREDWLDDAVAADFKNTLELYAQQSVELGACESRTEFYRMYTERSYLYSDSFIEATKQPYLTGGASSVVNQDDLENAFTSFHTIGRQEGNFTTSLLEDNRLLYDAGGNLVAPDMIETIKGVTPGKYEMGAVQYCYDAELVASAEELGLVRTVDGTTPGASSLNIPGTRTWAGENLTFSESELLMPAIDVSQYQASDVLLALEQQGYFEIRNPIVLYPDGRKAEAAGTFIITRLGGE